MSCHVAFDYLRLHARSLQRSVQSNSVSLRLLAWSAMLDMSPIAAMISRYRPELPPVARTFVTIEDGELARDFGVAAVLED